MILHSRRNSLLLEVLIAFAIIALCILPLLYPHVFIYRTQQEMIHTVELDHIVNLVYGKTLEKLYLNEIPWDTIKNGKPIPIDAEVIKDCGFGCPSPYTGTYKFIDYKHKPKKSKDKTLYLFNIIFEFNKINEKDKKKYEYMVVIEKLTP